MPNHYTNLLLGFAPYIEEEEGMPKNERIMDYHEVGYWTFSTEKFRKYYEKKCLCQIVRPMPKEIKDTEVRSEGKGRADPTGWYGWARINWGTKWGTYEHNCHKLGGDSSPIVIEFITAGGPPNQDVLKLIVEHFEEQGFKIFKVLGANPYDDSMAELIESSRG